MDKIEFTKTSLHNHFGGGSADYLLNDTNTHSFDINIAKKKVDHASTAGYQLLAMTNSNHLWKTYYDSLVNYISSKNYKITLIPGVEFNIVDDHNKPESDRKYLHLIFLLSPKSNLDNFETEVRQYRTDNGYNAITISNLTNLALHYKCILIPHGIKQSSSGRDCLTNHATFDNILSIRDFIPIMIEDNTESQREYLEIKIKQFISEEKFKWLESSASISSADRQDFSSITQPTYIWGEPSFDSLFYCAIVGKDRVLRETDIIEKSKYVKKLEIINKGGVLGTVNLSFSHGLNSIIGNSGSGKTLLLNLIKKELTGSNLKHAISSTESDYSSMYVNSEVKIYDNEDKIIKPNEINVFEGENLYKQIVATLNYDKDRLLRDLNATPSFDETEKIIGIFNKQLNKYIMDKITINSDFKNINESLTKTFASVDYLRSNKSVPGSIEYIVDSKLKTTQLELSTLITNLDNDIVTAKKSFDSIGVMLKKYGLNDEITKLANIRLYLMRKILLTKNEKRKNQINIDANLNIKSKIASIVSEYNKTIGQRTKVVNDSKQIVSDEIETIINKLKEITIIENQLSVPVLNSDALIKSVKKNDEIIKLANFKINEDIAYEDITEYFDSAIGSGQNKVLKGEFSTTRGKNDLLYPINLFDETKVKAFAEIFIAKGYTNSNIFRLIPNKFIQYDIMIKNLDEEYQLISSLSAGQLSKIYINMLIDSKLKAMENNAVILYDQPDNNLEKTFILDTLGRKLAELKKKYQVIITTHEPLLVVNSDSNSIIRAENDPVAGVSKVKYENLTMYDVGDKAAAIDKISKLIDGSHNAIKLRNKIYGGFDL